MLSTLAAGWLCRDPSSDPREVRDGALAALWSCQLVSMQGLLGSSRLFAYHLLIICLTPSRGWVLLMKTSRRQSPKFCRLLIVLHMSLLQCPRGEKEAILSLNGVNK